MFLGIDTAGQYEDEIMRGLHREVYRRNFFFHLFIIAFEVVMMVSISLRPGGPFAKPRRVAYFLLYLILIAVTAGVALAETWLNKKEDGHRLYFRIENTYMAFFCLWGIAITLNDQLGGNGLTVFNYVILMMAILCMMKPWKVALMILGNFILLNVLLPYFPDPNGLDNTYNNFVNSAFLSMAAIVIASNFYNSKITAKKDEIIIKNQYRQIRSINGMLKKEALVDALTGLKNRNSYNKVLEVLKKAGGSCFACVYIDVNGLHEINNHLGHEAGDEMLKAVADGLLDHFSPDEVFRIGGDEFVVLSTSLTDSLIEQKIKNLTERIGERGYSVSFGYECRAALPDGPALDIGGILQAAEAAMQKNKQEYYAAGGEERQMRVLNAWTENMIAEKRDMDQFLSVLAPAFKGVYFVDLETDTPRQLFIPDYFDVLLEETHNKFGSALMLYARRMVKPQYESFFRDVCDYGKLKEMLAEGRIPEFIYEKNDGGRLKLQILKFNHYHGNLKETLWIFSNLDVEDII